MNCSVKIARVRSRKQCGRMQSAADEQRGKRRRRHGGMLRVLPPITAPPESVQALLPAAAGPRPRPLSSAPSSAACT